MEEAKNLLANTDIKTSSEETSNENLNHNNDIKTSSDEETSEENLNHKTDIKPKKRSIEEGKSQLIIIKQRVYGEPHLKLWFPDDLEDINNENKSKEELESIADKIFKWNIYKCKYRDA